MLHAVADAEREGRRARRQPARDSDDGERAVLGRVADLEAHAREELAQKPPVRHEQHTAAVRPSRPRARRDGGPGAVPGYDIAEKELRANAHIVPGLPAGRPVDPWGDAMELRHPVQVVDGLPLRLPAALFPEPRVTEHRGAGGQEADDGLGGLERAGQVADEDGGEGNALQPLRDLGCLQPPASEEYQRIRNA